MSRRRILKAETEIKIPEQKEAVVDNVVEKVNLAAIKKVAKKKPVQLNVEKKDTKESPKKMNWSKKKIKIVAGTIIIVLLIGILLFAAKTKLRSRFFNSPRDNQLRDENNNVTGSIIEEKADNFKRVIYKFKANPPEDGYFYHGWFDVDGESPIKYAGEFYPADKGWYQLIFSSSEKDKEYPQVFVSLEKGQPGEKPAKIVAGGGIKGE